MDESIEDYKLTFSILKWAVQERPTLIRKLDSLPFIVKTEIGPLRDHKSLGEFWNKSCSSLGLEPKEVIEYSRFSIPDNFRYGR